MEQLHSTTDVKDLLLADYTYYGDWLHINEEAGDKRINLYITLLTAIPAGVIAIADKSGFDILKHQGVQITLLIALVALMPFGIFIFLRLCKRNYVTDELKFTLDTLRQQYMDIFDTTGLLSYVMLPRDENPLVLKKDKPSNSRKWVSLVYLVLLLNTLVSTAVIFLILTLLCLDTIVIIIAMAAGVTLAIILHLREIKSMSEKIIKKTDNNRFTHAGGIVVRKSNSSSQASSSKSNAAIEYLLITSSKPNEQGVYDIVFPKGHIELNEEISLAALREVFEETGVIAKIVRPIPNFSKLISGSNERINVKNYLMEYLDQAGTTEKRTVKWLSFEKAYAELSFSESKLLLLQTHAILMATPS